MPKLCNCILRPFVKALRASYLQGVCFSTLLLVPMLLLGQNTPAYKPKFTRILFVLDGSGSMKDKWGEQTKFEIAKKLLARTVDSIQKADPTVEIGIRIFGHQNTRDEKNCKDTKLEVPFAKANKNEVEAALGKVDPKGWTLIAYSIYQAAQDFPTQPDVKNALIIVTDGLETCGGDICAASKMLKEKRITLKPFIIGMGLKPEEEKAFNCVGAFINAGTEQGFKQALTTTVAQSLGTTTVQINLLDGNGKPTETNVEISIYDSHSHQLVYNFVHSLNEAGLPDTLRLDPVGEYDVLVHTIPSVGKQQIQLEPGVHNTIPIISPQGSLKILEGAGYKTSYLQCMVSISGTHQTLDVQSANSISKYLVGAYDIEALTLPRLVFKNVQIEAGKTKELQIPASGTLNLLFAKQGIGSIYRNVNGELEMVYQFDQLQERQTLELLPGQYIFIYRLASSSTASETEQSKFDISSGNITTLKF
ncbi:MAG: VWA domain-containing protein [Chitinophagales bacterium]|nr:VWA domain-containing protein [Chitinophagales bacterium]